MVVRIANGARPSTSSRDYPVIIKRSTILLLVHGILEMPSTFTRTSNFSDFYGFRPRIPTLNYTLVSESSMLPSQSESSKGQFKLGDIQISFWMYKTMFWIRYASNWWTGPCYKCTLDSILEDACWNVNESVLHLNSAELHAWDFTVWIFNTILYFQRDMDR